ncbi:uncharacterized protein EDB91DRAFT_1344869 [Suillus paluster]|uniref:uncharacterized protein n=1 Tax=Suillus paluster TaxID=48578 RepID=UPI001B86F8E6|nr:uncharacterized protein EDB91DRAFT_1344869 [Suillus paluster]KAG1748309.1 hypothetical protein EDB91DRAFT_1344869 [Suillus paluster]
MMRQIMSTRTLVQLPPELLCHTLAFLDAYDLVRVRKTCKALKAMVDDSETLQYVIDLSYFQMIPVGISETDVPPATRRKQLRQHDAAWQRIGYKQRCTLPSFMSGSIYEFVGGIYGSVGEDCIHFARLPSPSDSGDLYYWSQPIDIMALADFTFCAAQDLLIVVTYSPDVQSRAYDIHLRSLTTNDAHPDAARPFLKALDNADIGRRISGPSGHVKVQIIRNYINMLCRNVIGNVPNVVDCVQMWDWKSPNEYQFILLFDDGIDDCSFIAEDKFLVIVDSKTMEIYSIADKSKPPQCTAKLSFPSLMGDFSYTSAFTSENPTPGSIFPYSRKFHQQPSCSFHPSTNDQLIGIVVRIARNTNPRDSHLYRFFTRCSAILELEGLFSRTYGQSTSGGPKLLWSMWGPQHTTWFRFRENENWEPSLYGFRTVESIDRSTYFVSRTPRQLRIRDFNPHIAWNYGAEDTSKWCGRLVRGEVARMILRPFTEPLGSALAYREFVSEELFDVTETKMDESRILLLKNDDNGDLKNIEALVF